MTTPRYETDVLISAHSTVCEATELRDLLLSKASSRLSYPKAPPWMRADRNAHVAIEGRTGSVDARAVRMQQRPWNLAIPGARLER